MTDREPEFLKTAEAAALLGIHHITLARWRLEGRGPRFVRLSRRAVRYLRSDIDAWVRENTHQSTTETR